VRVHENVIVIVGYINCLMFDLLFCNRQREKVASEKKM
jgi:hypothetical protein